MIDLAPGSYVLIAATEDIDKVEALDLAEMIIKMQRDILKRKRDRGAGTQRSNVAFENDNADGDDSA